MSTENIFNWDYLAQSLPGFGELEYLRKVLGDEFPLRAARVQPPSSNPILASLLFPLTGAVTGLKDWSTGLRALSGTPGLNEVLADLERVHATKPSHAFYLIEIAGKLCRAGFTVSFEPCPPDPLTLKRPDAILESPGTRERFYFEVSVQGLSAMQSEGFYLLGLLLPASAFPDVRLWRRLPLFTTYVLFKFLVTAALWLVYKRLGYDSAFAYYFFWSMQSLLLVTRASVCAELCWLVFKSRPGLWFHARRVLISITAAILIYAAVDAHHQVSVATSFILTFERGLELTIAILLISFLLISSRYRIPIERISFLIAVGMCIHSAFLILNNTLLKHWLDPYFSWWNNVQVISFQVALVIWLFALRRPLPETKPAPTLLRKDTYHLYAQLIGQRLKGLDRDIQEVMKP